MQRANATKPKRNSSRAVDFQKRNLNSELTVTVPESFVIEGGVKKVDEGGKGKYWYGMSTGSVIKSLSLNPLMGHFKKCFDQFKIMETSLSVELRKPPIFDATIKGMLYHNEWIKCKNMATGEIGDVPAIAEGVFTDEVLTQIRGVFPSRKIIMRTGLDGQPYKFPIEIPFTVAAASRRVIPEYYFKADGANVYKEPTWEELMSYGSVVWESKLPGTSIHLELDVQGSSNAERMMTFPTEALDKLGELTPMLQAGRFCPFVMIGVKFKFLDDFEVLSVVASTVSSYSVGSIQGSNGPVLSDVIPEGGQLAYYNGVQYYNMQINGVNYQIAGKGYFDFNCTEQDLQQAGINGGVDYLVPLYTNPSDVKYQLGVQGYHVVRMKQLRSVVSDFIGNYSLLDPPDPRSLQFFKLEMSVKVSSSGFFSPGYHRFTIDKFGGSNVQKYQLASHDIFFCNYLPVNGSYDHVPNHGGCFAVLGYSFSSLQWKVRVAFQYFAEDFFASFDVDRVRSYGSNGQFFNGVDFISVLYAPSAYFKRLVLCLFRDIGYSNSVTVLSREVPGSSVPSGVFSVCDIDVSLLRRR